MFCGRLYHKRRPTGRMAKFCSPVFNARLSMYSRPHLCAGFVLSGVSYIYAKMTAHGRFLSGATPRPNDCSRCQSGRPPAGDRSGP
jgi:hypothetical protein